MRTKDLLITYDVNTTTQSGRRRLRRVAQLCERYGQRVQCSVFEVRVTEAMLEELETRLRKTIDEETDSLRLYEFLGGRDQAVTAFGVDGYRDFDEPLII